MTDGFARCRLCLDASWAEAIDEALPERMTPVHHEGVTSRSGLRGLPGVSERSQVPTFRFVLAWPITVVPPAPEAPMTSLPSLTSAATVS